MRKLLAIALSLPLVACVVGSGTEVGDDEGGGGGDGSGDGSGSGDGGGISGKIETDTQWSGNVLISGLTTIEPGVTVTVAAGTSISVKPGVSITVNGILDAQGTSAAKIIITSESAQQNFGGFAVYGELRLNYVEQTGGAITTFANGKATIIDTRMSRVAGDFLMMNGGTIDVSYSAVGREVGEPDTTHCNMHFGGAGNVIKVTHSNISTSDYALMFYGGMGADFTYNNWFGNGIDVDTLPSAPVTGDFSNGWFEKGAPVGAGLTANNLAGARLVACDGTNDALCAGPRP
jgi:hypothetical protein